ncbi:hypothetical protein HYH03_005272 [Edaphochlamys debaryana]|uniref:Transmembrane protein n=1 Tax=Edaphochlamys debaryana TaxID=47281 RepID=A0A836C2J2_9CHLO|nr:hypothetical protein HYH03_005272 [Edaphochlamys debaryana]|eukprot:KAG2496872.1 hypothetical protein HYH03_005272 [Edaphochlamys debaryana]
MSAPSSGPSTATTSIATTIASVSVPEPLPAFTPQPPEPSVLIAQGVVLLSTVTAGAYWWLVVVPSERAALGRSKRMGAMASYLQELERPEAAEQKKLERWFYTDWLRQRELRQQRRAQTAADSASASTSQPQQAQAQAQNGTAGPGPVQDPYDNLPDSAGADDNLLRPTAATPTPRFLSLDNPIVATAALLLLVGLASGLAGAR